MVCNFFNSIKMFLFFLCVFYLYLYKSSSQRLISMPKHLQLSFPLHILFSINPPPHFHLHSHVSSSTSTSSPPPPLKLDSLKRPRRGHTVAVILIWASLIKLKAVKPLLVRREGDLTQKASR